VIGQTISHYRIESRLGQGGMGIVYRAVDTRLQRPVALKFLAPELTRDSQARARFVNEARAAASLNHPHIATIYEIDEAAGQTFIAMEFVPGPSLAERIAQGPLPPAEAMRITGQVASGLARAHRQGIVHRDIKPANILLSTTGEAKIVDFGLARLGGQTRLTMAGMTMGTVAYMSPEQARGGDVDHRTDIWALGVVHYEMLTGRLPFRGDHPQALIHSILHSRPLPVTEIDPSLPPLQDQLLRRALAKDPAQRYRSALDLTDPAAEQATAAITSTAGWSAAWRTVRWRSWPWRWLLPVSILVAAIVLAAVLLLPIGHRESAFTARDWLLIAEFRNLSEEEHLESALREALVVDMEQSQHVNVFSGKRLSDALERMGRSPAQPLTSDLAGELAVREGIPVVLTGSVSSLGGAYLVAAQLVRPATGEAIFATRVEAAGQQELLPALDELSREIRQTLGESLRAIRTRDEPLASVTTGSLAALRLFSEGQQAFLASDWDRARDLLGRAVAEDSTFAMAYAKLARIDFYSANTADALAYSARAYRWRERLTRRERYYIEGEYHRYRAEYSEAIKSLRALLAEYPDDLESRTNLATTYMWTLQYENALQVLAEFDSGYRDTWYYHHTLGNTYGGMGRYAEAVGEFQRALALNPAQLRSRMCLSWGLLCAGEWSAAADQLDSLRASRQSGIVGTDYLLAKTLPALGQLDRALVRLQEARQEALANGNQDQAAWTYIYEGFCHDLRGDEVSAEEAFAAAVEMWSADTSLLYLGRAYAQRGKLALAEQVRQRLEQIHRDEPTTTNEQLLRRLEGEIAFARGDARQAATSLQGCLPGYMFNLGARFTLGRAYLELGEPAAARREFAFLDRHRFSTFLEGQAFLWPLSRYWSGRAAEAQGDTAAAIADLGDFLEIWQDADADLPQLVDARERLTALRAGR
jgi:tetratricopeptide (TPR) repeat protein